MSTKPTIRYDPDPACWGAGTTDAQAARWNAELNARIKKEFPQVAFEAGPGPWTFADEAFEAEVRVVAIDEGYRIRCGQPPRYHPPLPA